MVSTNRKEQEDIKAVVETINNSKSDRDILAGQIGFDMSKTGPHNHVSVQDIASNLGVMLDNGAKFKYSRALHYALKALIKDVHQSK